ncbi:LURP-one-related family protein [Acholeplasma equirhinis]|uniref:LURP-one-related/scramblase family protein n=1 Tax=Acholeplasma equirhinis TaxID=555393 RepID=UPI00197AFB40|nr:LURP-one-related family protein [Acholeplasma equirhinis]MBN3490428.1 LURP-one-related family protein [Acholeplasma equirhinis]
MKLYIKQKIFAIADTYNVYDANQNLQYKIDGKIFSWRGKMSLVDRNGKVLYNFSHRILHFFNRYLDIQDANEQPIGVIKKHFTFFIPKYSADIKGEHFEISGQILAYNFAIIKNGRVVAAVNKKWLSWGDTYEIDILDGENIPLMVSLVIGIDSLTHNDRYGDNHHG